MVCNMVVYYLKAFSQAGCGSDLLKPPAVCTLGCQQSDHIVEEICLFAPSVLPPPPQITYRPIKMHCRSMHSVMCDHVFFPLRQLLFSRGTGAFFRRSQLPVTVVNIFILGSDLLLHRRNVINELEVLVRTDLNANVIHSVNNLLWHLLESMGKSFLMRFYFSIVKYNMTLPVLFSFTTLGKE